MEGGSDASTEALRYLLGDIFSEYEHKLEVRFHTTYLCDVNSLCLYFPPPINEIMLSDSDSSLGSSDEEIGLFFPDSLDSSSSLQNWRH